MQDRYQLKSDKPRRFVIGDVHGEISKLRKILTHWRAEEELIVFLGDLMDRGEDSKAVLELVYDLVLEGSAQVVLGNHDQMLLDYLRFPSTKAQHYFRNGGDKTVLDLLGAEAMSQSPSQNAQSIQMAYPWLEDFLDSFPLYIEWADYLFVHAGVDPTLDNWRDTRPDQFYWIRESFFRSPNPTDKIILFGHTPTRILHPNRSDDLWMSGDGLIGLDGGAVYDGKLHALSLAADQIVAHYYS